MQLILSLRMINQLAHIVAVIAVMCTQRSTGDTVNKTETQGIALYVEGLLQKSTICFRSACD